MSPVVGWWISRPLRPVAASLSGTAAGRSCGGCRDARGAISTDFVGPENNWLPPDNFQEYPSAAIAARTSPTNMGMALLANLAAHDLGYISTGEFLRRTDRALRTMEQLERFHGHFYNWYDTHTLQPLHPQYVSSVDSGNLAGSLFALRVGLGELKNQSVLSPRVFDGLDDTLLILAGLMPTSPDAETVGLVKSLRGTLHSLDGGWDDAPGLPQALLEGLHIATKRLVDAASSEAVGEFRYWARALNRQCRRFRDDLASLVPDPWRFETVPTLEQLATAEVTLERDHRPAYSRPRGRREAAETHRQPR